MFGIWVGMCGSECVCVGVEGMCGSGWVCVGVGGYVWELAGMWGSGWVCVVVGGYVWEWVDKCIQLGPTTIYVLYHTHQKSIKDKLNSSPCTLYLSTDLAVWVLKDRLNGSE